MEKGAPETGDIPGAVPKPETLELAKYGHLIHEYGPTTGIHELREKVAEYYNSTFRTKWDSKYTADNICIVPGGRAGLSRVASVISPILLGYQLPDYAAYSELYVEEARDERDREADWLASFSSVWPLLRISYPSRPS